jgi:hypothetical protein
VEVNLKLAVIEGEQRLLAIIRDISERKEMQGVPERIEQVVESK